VALLNRDRVAPVAAEVPHTDKTTPRGGRIRSHHV
jgi:hypothetical protein